MGGVLGVAEAGPDPEQVQVIDAPAGVRQLVTAGPGSGKTWTAAQRLAKLARGERTDEEPGLLLALAFSRAAAAATAAALSAAGVRQFVEVRTLDSWATALLRSRWTVPADYLDDRLEASGFDDRVEMLLAAVTAEEVELPEALHVVVDEAQDVFGARADLVLRMLRSPRTNGWTVLGDRAQSIFEFDSDGTQSLLDQIEGSDLQHTRREISRCHRTKSSALLRIREVGGSLRASAPRDEDLRAVRDECLLLNQLSEANLVVAAPGYISRGEHTAVLFRDNRNLLAMSRRLSEKAIEHRIASGRAEGVVPAWVAQIDRGGHQSISEEDVHAAVPKGLDADLVFDALKIVCSRGRGSLVKQTIANAVATRFLPEPLLQEEPSGMVLSTVHRAKGLEFLRVLVTPGIWDKAGESVEEARTLYVAMTRATVTLARLTPADGKPSTRPDRISYPVRRLVERSFATNSIVAVELVPLDVDWRNPRHTLTERVERFERLSLGEEVTLERSERSVLPTWTVLDIAGRELARTPPEFVNVARTLLNVENEKSSRLVGARVSGFMTLPLPPGALPDGRQLVRCPILRGMISNAR